MSPLTKTSQKFLPELNTLLLHFYGAITMEEIIAFVGKIYNSDDFHPGMNSIVDFRQACLLFDNEDVKKYVDFSSGFSSVASKERKISMLTTTPQQATHSMLFQAFSKGMPAKVEVFNTLESAIDWIDVPREYFNKINMFLLEAGLES